MTERLTDDELDDLLDRTVAWMYPHSTCSETCLLRAKGVAVAGRLRELREQNASITRATSENVERLLRYEYSVGSIEGTVEALNIHEDNRFTVYDTVSNAAVRCFFEDADLLKVKDAIGKKVLVYGRLRRDQDGRPNQIRPVRFFRLIDQPPAVPVPSPVGLFSGLGDSRSYLDLIRNE